MKEKTPKLMKDERKIESLNISMGISDSNYAPTMLCLTLVNPTLPACRAMPRTIIQL